MGMRLSGEGKEGGGEKRRGLLVVEKEEEEEEMEMVFVRSRYMCISG